MTTTTENATQTTPRDSLTFWKLVPVWFDYTFAGTIWSINRNRIWIRAYAISVALMTVIHRWLHGTTLLDAAMSEIPALVVGLIFLGLGMRWGFAVHMSDHRRRFAGGVVGVSAVLGLCAVTVPLLPFPELVGTSLGGAGLAWGAATALIFLILVFPSTSFNPDFAHLRMFRRVTRYLEALAGLFLFVVAGRYILLWPQLLPHVLSADQYLESLVSAPVAAGIGTDVLDIAGTVLVTVILVFTVMALYLHLAKRWWAWGVWDTYKAAVRLLWRNLRHRLHGPAEAIWPPTPRRPSDEEGDAKKERVLVENFLFHSTLAAISLSFGLWAPKVAPPGYSVLNFAHYDRNNLLALIVLVFFLAGGIDIWLYTIETAGNEGVARTFGFWLGGFCLYWPTTLLVAVGMVDVVQFSTSLATDQQMAINLQNTFAVSYRASIGALTLLTAIGKSHQLGDEPQLPRTLRYGLATVGLFTLGSFAVYALGRLPGATSIVGWMSLALAGAAAFALYFVPSGRQLRPDPTNQAQVIVAPSLALAPLLLSERIVNTAWSENGLADVTINGVGVSPEPLHLRVFVAGSDDEVAFETISEPHARLRGHADFVITDLRTAAKIIGAYNVRSGFRKRYLYKIISIVATVPWQRVIFNHQGGAAGQGRMVLDSGYLRFNPAFHPVEDPEHFGCQHPERCRPTSLPTVAYYAAYCFNALKEVFISEPYYSWLSRIDGRRQTPSFGPPEGHRLVTYVLLARCRLGTAAPAVPYNWRRTLCEMVREGQQSLRESQSVINHTDLHKIHSFLQKAIGARVDLELEDIYLGLCSSDFDATFRAMSPSERELSVRELDRNCLIDADTGVADFKARILNHDDVHAVMVDVLRKSEPKVTDDDTSDDEQFFRRFCVEPAGEAATPLDKEVQEHLHTVGVIPLLDQPGALAGLLAELNDGTADDVIDLALLSSANLGDAVVVYCLDRKNVPCLDNLTPSKYGRPYPPIQTPIDWEARLRKPGRGAKQMKVFMVPVPHHPGGLKDAVQKLKGVAINKGINLELVFAFPGTDGVALAVMVTKPRDWTKAYCALRGESVPESDPVVPYPPDAASVHLDRRITFERHNQYVIFDADLRPGESARFNCPRLPTWTPNRGAIESWHAEVRFGTVRLMIPTILQDVMVVSDFLVRLPLLGAALHWLERWVPGLAGCVAYSDAKQWHMVVVPACGDHG